MNGRLLTQSHPKRKFYKESLDQEKHGKYPIYNEAKGRIV